MTIKNIKISISAVVLAIGLLLALGAGAGLVLWWQRQRIPSWQDQVNYHTAQIQCHASALQRLYKSCRPVTKPSNPFDALDASEPWNQK